MQCDALHRRLRARVIEHNRMETGRDARGIRSLNRHTLEQIVAASPAAVLVADANDPRSADRLRQSRLRAPDGLYARRSSRASRGPCSRARGRRRLRRRAQSRDRSRRGVPRRRSPICARTARRGRATISVTPLRGARGELRYFLLSHERAPATCRASSGCRAGARCERRDLAAAARARPRATEDRDDGSHRSRDGLVRFPYFQEMLRRDLAMARRDRRFVTLLVFEIVEYDIYRQTFGDKAADSCQRMIGAQIMRTLRRAGDLCARYDESTLVAAVDRAACRRDSTAGRADRRERAATQAAQSARQVEPLHRDARDRHRLPARCARRSRAR